jgi:hypothetical protein
VRKGKWKLVAVNFGKDTEKLELFDIESDPGEKNNLASSNAAKLAELRAIMDAARPATNRAVRLKPKIGEIGEVGARTLNAAGSRMQTHSVASSKQLRLSGSRHAERNSRFFLTGRKATKGHASGIQLIKK